MVNTGLQFDRQWMLIDQEGQFLSQRRLSVMARLATAITNDRHLKISAMGLADYFLPLAPTEGHSIRCTIWGDWCTAWHVSTDADLWFSTALNQACRLVYLQTNEIRLVDQNYGGRDDRVAFSDGFPFLIIAQNSLNALNEKSPVTLSMARFRPNLVVSGCAAYAEDQWREITIGDIGFRLPKPCSRCVIPSINPKTAEIEPDALLALKNTRKWQSKLYFGQNALHNQIGRLKIGAEIVVKITGDSQPPLQ